MAEEMFYHAPGCEPHKLTVAKKNSDGTVVLADGDTVIITGCPVGPQANEQHGYAVEIERKAKAKKKNAKPDDAPEGSEPTPEPEPAAEGDSPPSEPPVEE